MSDETPKTTLVLGGGPAGLTAGYLLVKEGHRPVVLEAEDQVGGLAKTVERDGYRFDLGGHRFFTKSQEVNDLWHEVMGGEFLLRPRMSRIYWNNRYLDYPLRGPDVIKKLGPIELARCMTSYARAAAKRNKVDNSLEDWVTNRFGRRLFELFFKTYNEKVWGAPASEIRAEWAAQRIKGLSFFSAARAAFFGNKGNKVKSLISAFNYPRYGPGQMWERMADAIAAQGGEVRLEAPVERIELVGGRVVEVEAGGELYELPDFVISSLPLREVVEMVHPHAPREVQDAARGLNYRDFLTVALVVDGEDLFPDNWIYIHEPKVQVGRIQNYRSWSPWMVPDQSKACVGLEYFCFAGDELWSMDDDDLVQLAAKELEQLGLVDRSKVERGYVTPTIAATIVAAVGIGVVHTMLGLFLSLLTSRGKPRVAISRAVQLAMMVVIVLALLSAVEVLPRRLFGPLGMVALIGFPVLLVLEGIIAPIEFFSTLSSVLSYVRIMALGTASVLLAAVANDMVGVFGSVLVGVVFALLFHLVNFAMGVFSPTIHALRLHYVEFFKQFYSPGGRPYEPFRHREPRRATTRGIS